MIAELEAAGCDRFYPQVFLDEDDPSDSTSSSTPIPAEDNHSGWIHDA